MKNSRFQNKLKGFDLNSSQINKIEKIFDQTNLDFDHSFKVAQLIKQNYKPDNDLIIAALIHDISQSDNYSLEDINKLFGKEVGFLIKSTTKAKDLSAQNLPKGIEDVFYQKKLKSARKMLLSAGKDLRVVLLKISETIVNLSSKSMPNWKKEATAQFALQILIPLAERLMLNDIKIELARLSFKITQPQEYKKLKNKVGKLINDFDLKPKKIENKLIKELKKEGVKNFKIKYRQKSLYSIHTKLKKRNLKLSELHDIIGFRIISQSQEDCYKILGLVNRLWQTGVIKDYIRDPKPNGYQSIHAIVKKDNKEFEIQIRTKKMEDMAERGPWAHWHYKDEGATSKVSQDQKWAKQLADKLKKSQAKNFKELRINLFKNKIFVYTPEKEVIELPKGATPIDFAYYIHSDLGDYLKGSNVDGKLVKLDQELKNGQTVEIIKDKKRDKKRPTRDWLKYAKTNRAKEKIRKKLREE